MLATHHTAEACLLLQPVRRTITATLSRISPSSAPPSQQGPKSHPPAAPPGYMDGLHAPNPRAGPSMGLPPPPGPGQAPTGDVLLQSQVCIHRLDRV